MEVGKSPIGLTCQSEWRTSERLDIFYALGKLELDVSGARSEMRRHSSPGPSPASPMLIVSIKSG